MKRYIAIIFTLLAAVFVSAQDVGEADADRVAGLPQQSLKEISVDKFEQEGYWKSYISTDTGYATSRLFSGGPAAKNPLGGETDLNMTDNNVFGTRIDFLRRGHTSIYVNAMRPIPVEGIAKTVSVWVAGRNYNHRMYLILEDSRGHYFELYMGRLNFQGWKRMTVAIPPQQNEGNNGIIQNDYHYTSNMGIRVIGFRVDIDPMEAYGTYYVYFDDLRAVTDLFAEDNRDPDDPRDDW